MLANKVFFSFTEVDASRHQEYNAWHQLDHMPENLALPGVTHGQRWVRSPDCAEAGAPPAEFLAGMHYATMYWFRDPVEESFQEWRRLGEQTYQLGRRQELPYTRRPLMGAFTPVKGYAAPRVRVSPDVIPFRPNQGLEINVLRIDEPRSEAAHELYAWHDQVHIPEVLSCAGAAGAWTFSSRHVSLGRPSFGDKADFGAGELRVLAVFLDEDPLEYLAEKKRLVGEAPGDSAATTLLSSTLRTITPWQWNWFD
ncbi:hypothetical protein [Actinomadura sp. 9N407]|uniref:hypothetical protein n=1 Tax=Actinomadura sp. 9N407 TaxID=3375154 RepID=UPI0037ACB4A1